MDRKMTSGNILKRRRRGHESERPRGSEREMANDLSEGQQHNAFDWMRVNSKSICTEMDEMDL
jgi:hypothetical protein